MIVLMTITIHHTSSRNSSLPPDGLAPRLSTERRQTTIDRLQTGRLYKNSLVYLLTYLLTYLQGCIVGKVGAETSRSVRETGRSTGSRLLHTSNSHQKSTVVLPRVPGHLQQGHAVLGNAQRTFYNQHR